MRPMNQRGELIYCVGCSTMLERIVELLFQIGHQALSACVGLFDAASTAFHRAALVRTLSMN